MAEAALDSGSRLDAWMAGVAGMTHITAWQAKDASINGTRIRALNREFISITSKRCEGSLLWQVVVRRG